MIMDIKTLLFCMVMSLGTQALHAQPEPIPNFYKKEAVLQQELSELRAYLLKRPKYPVKPEKQYLQEYIRVCVAATQLNIPCSRIKISNRRTSVSLAADYIFINESELKKLTHHQLLFTLGHEWGHVMLKHGELQLLAYLKAELISCQKCFRHQTPLEIAIKTGHDKNAIYRDMQQVQLRWKHELEADSYAIALMLRAGIEIDRKEIISDLDGNSPLDISGTVDHPPLDLRISVIDKTIQAFTARQIDTQAARSEK
jgi:hypothetical protein